MRASLPALDQAVVEIFSGWRFIRRSGRTLRFGFFGTVAV